jgi:hypothetical protein
MGFSDPRVWAEERLIFVPDGWQDVIRSIHAARLDAAAAIPAGTGAQSEAERLANIWLFDTTERMKHLRVPIHLKDWELCEMAERLAKRAMGLSEIVPGRILQPAQLRTRLEGFVGNYGIIPPDQKIEDAPAIARMTDSLWWRRKLRIHQARLLEQEAIGLGYVHRAAQIYASDATVERRTQQRKRNAQALADTEMENVDTGQIYNLAELAEVSIANPRIRRGELMVRIKGFEHVADGLGHVSEFVTVTTPSKFHPKTTQDGRVIDNPKWNGANPRDAQQYLTKLWARTRAQLARESIRVYGFRIAEAHHDATPHWHLLLFMEAKHRGRFREIVSQYGLAEDGHEPGAQKNRVNFVAIDPSKGTAAGYIAKYVAKNVHGGGYQVQDDVEGEGYETVNTSPRIEAWASTWGIRQFQQIGGPPVGVWRELRRTEISQAISEVVKDAHSAADTGNWRRFVEVMGGPTQERRNLPLRVAYSDKGLRYLRRERRMVPKATNRYGETARGEVFGIFDVMRARVCVSRRFEWRVLKSENGAAVRPWTRVNNYTQGGEARNLKNRRSTQTGGKSASPRRKPPH